MITAHVALLAASLVAAPEAADVAALQYRGDAAAALRTAEVALAARPDDAPLRLAATAAAIEAGALRRARALLAPLLRDPLPPRAAVLRALLARREQASREPLTRALAAAWRDAGKPDLSADDALAPRLPPRPPGAAPLPPAERLLFEVPEGPEARLQLALAASEAPASAPAVVHLQVLGALSHAACPADPTALDAAVERTLAALRRAMPGNGYVELAGLLARCPRALGDGELAALEAAADRPRFEYPRAEAFEQLVALARRRDPGSARLLAAQAWLALDVAGSQLPRLAEQLPDGARRQRAGRLLERVGARLAAGSAWLEVMMGSSMALRGLQLQPPAPGAEEVRAAAAWQQARYRAWSEARARMGRWPFAAAWREWSPAEVADALDLMTTIGEGPR